MVDPSAALEETANAAKNTGTTISGELGKFGKTFFAQLLGIKDDEEASGEEVKKKDDDDKKFSDEAYAKMVQQVYDMYEARKKREAEIEGQNEEKQEKAEELAEVNQLRASNNAVNTAVAKGSAEIGKNYGAE